MDTKRKEENEVCQTFKGSLRESKVKTKLSYVKGGRD